jgi:hypothetical protein
MKYQGAHREELPTVADVGRALGSEVAALVETHLGEPQRVSGITINDFCLPPKSFPGGIALLIGAAPTGVELNALFNQLADAGYVAVVYKAYGGADVALREAARSAGVAAFRAADGIPWNQLTEFFRAAIVPRSESSHSLVDIRPGELFELANAVASMAGGAVAICDPGQTVLAYSTLAEQPIDDTRRASILRLHVPPTEQNDQDYWRVHAARKVVCVAPEKNSMPRSAVAIRAGEVILGSLWLIDAANAADQDTERILLEASNVAALHLLHRRTHHDAERARTVELVKPLLFERDRAELAALQLGLLTAELRVAAMSAIAAGCSTPETVRSSMLLFDTVRTACTVRLPGAICGFSDNIVYIVLPQGPSSSAPFQRATLLRITHHAHRILGRPVLAGLGSQQSVVGAVQSRTDAESVLAMLLQDFDNGRITADSNEIVADPQSLGARLHLRRIVTLLRESGQLPGDFATRIAAHDARRKTSYEVTIRTFLDCNSNAIETATKLGLHSNTVRYRLSRVESLFGVNLDSPENRLLVWLQLTANQM